MELDVKRLYIDTPIKAKCPNCGDEIYNDYLSYPLLNEEFVLYFWCGECHTSFTKKALLRITLDIKDET